MKWTTTENWPERASSYQLKYKGWVINIGAHYNERHRHWSVLSSDGKRAGEWRSGYSTGLRRVAHIIAKGNYHRLTVETRNVPADVNELWYALEDSFDRHYDPTCYTTYSDGENNAVRIPLPLTDAF